MPRQIGRAFAQSPLFGGRGRPRLDRVLLLPMPEANTRLAALRPAPRSIGSRCRHRTASPPCGRRASPSSPAPYPHVWPWVFAAGRQGSPLSRCRVRQALNYCFDRAGWCNRNEPKRQHNRPRLLLKQPEWVLEVMRPMLGQDGDALPVSAFSGRGSTARTSGPVPPEASPSPRRSTRSAASRSRSRNGSPRTASSATSARSFVRTRRFGPVRSSPRPRKPRLRGLRDVPAIGTGPRRPTDSASRSTRSTAKGRRQLRRHLPGGRRARRRSS